MRRTGPNRQPWRDLLAPAGVLPLGLAALGRSVAGRPGAGLGCAAGALLGLPVFCGCLAILLLEGVLRRVGEAGLGAPWGPPTPPKRQECKWSNGP